MSSNERNDPSETRVDSWRMHAGVSQNGEVAFKKTDGLYELIVGDWLHAEQTSDDSWRLQIGNAEVIVNLNDNAPPDVKITRG